MVCHLILTQLGEYIGKEEWRMKGERKGMREGRREAELSSGLSCWVLMLIFSGYSEAISGKECIKMCGFI